MAARDVEFAHVSFTAPGGQRILHDVSFRVKAGSTTALLGRSGSGKTTLLRSVNALVRPTEGQVLVGGEDVGAAEVVGLRRGIGYVVQESGLFPHMSVERNVAMTLELAGEDIGQRQRRARELLGMVGLPDDAAARYPWQLSGGQRQRVGVARALANDPQVLLMDEPFGALDPLTRAEMQTMLLELLRSMGKTTLIVTHDLDEALFLADRVVLMQVGAVAADMAAGDVLGSTNEAMRAYVAAATRVREAGPGAPILRNDGRGNGSERGA
jgi:osmoprotectant transport system ATP-binding protein